MCGLYTNRYRFFYYHHIISAADIFLLLIIYYCARVIKLIFFRICTYIYASTAVIASQSFIFYGISPTLIPLHKLRHALRALFYLNVFSRYFSIRLSKSNF